MQRIPRVFHVLSTLPPGRVRSRNVVKKMNADKLRTEREQRVLDYQPADMSQLKYPPHHTPQFVLRNGWSPPPEEPPDLPFQVARTAKGKFLPVYRDFKNARTRVVTIVRKPTGDLEEFKGELEQVCLGERAEERGGSLHVPGDHVHAVRSWLVGLGF